jgi:di/tricarboxylate transporter
MAFKSADLILNIGLLRFAEIEMSEVEWFKYMGAPTAVTAAIVLAIFIFIFKKGILGLRIAVDMPERKNGAHPRFSAKEKLTLAIVLVTVALWMTSSLHGISPVIITFAATLLFFIIRAMVPRDILRVDLATLVFLSAAFSIGGVLKACGAADIIFSRLGNLLPKQYSLLYAAAVIVIAMLMHMILGSNTTTCSVVIPGLLVICGGIFPPAIIAFITYNSMIYHAILPFHSVSVMVCAGNGYFPAKYVTRLGIPLTAVVFISILFVYIPWWKLLGYF